MMMTVNVGRIGTSRARGSLAQLDPQPQAELPSRVASRSATLQPTDLSDYTKGWKTAARGQIGPMPVWAHKGLLEDSHARSPMYPLPCFHPTKVELNSCRRHCMVNKAKCTHRLCLDSKRCLTSGIDASCCTALDFSIQFGPQHYCGSS